ncbi:MAG: slipin family protein [Flavipsychrobacter sp.]
MKKVRINVGNVGLVFKNGDYKRVIAAGAHWLSFGESVEVYDMTKRFVSAIDLNILLEDDTLASMLNIVNVKDNELALRFDEGNLKEVLIAGKYVYWKSIRNYTFTKVDLTNIEISDTLDKSIVNSPLLVNYIRICVIASYEKGLLLVDNKFQKELSSGRYLFWKNATTVAVEKVDLRRTRMEISSQEILTKDKAAIRINFEAQYRVTDINKALVENKGFEKQLYVAIQMIVRAYTSTLTLDELLEQKDEISIAIQKAAETKAADLGVEVSNCGIKDIILPGDVKDIMNQVLIAQKKAQANVISRREETASARSQLNTAKMMEENPMLFKLKEMEYVAEIAERINNISLSGGNQIIDQMKTLFS